MKPIPHSPEWYDRLAQLQVGYYYPWKSLLPPINGEDIYLEMLETLLLPDMNMLDVGCGHGEVSIKMATRCKSILAYDRVQSYIEIAKQTARRKGINNTSFICADSSISTNHKPRIPAEDNSFDMLTSRRGPLHWLEDARRVARAGAIILQLNPMTLPPPPWNEQLPVELRLPIFEKEGMRKSVERRLASGRLALHSCWTFEVQELFSEPYQLYKMLSWGLDKNEAPTWETVRPFIEQIFTDYAQNKVLNVPFGRLLWKAVVEK